MKLPKSDDNNQTGRLGVTILQARLEREGWIFRRQDGDSDFGVDGEIEVVDRNSVTGRLIKCQVKSSDCVEFDDEGEESLRVKTTTYNLWRESPLLTLIFHVDTSDDSIYWTPALAHFPQGDAKSLKIRFEKSSNIRDDLGSLRSYLDSWFAVSSSEAVLRDVALFHRIYEELQQEIGGYDAWMPMDDEDRFRLFYAHALRLRLAVGLSNAKLPMLGDWQARSEGMWGDSDPLFWGTFDEAMHVIGPAYDEALSRIEARLANVELTVENHELWNFIEQRKTGHATRIMKIDPRSKTPKFHSEIEEKLRQVNALKFRFGTKAS